MTSEAITVSDTDIAIVAMAGRFPGASNPDQLWERVVAGEDCLTDLTAEALAERGIPAAIAADDAYVRRAGVIDDVAGFDHDLFGIGERDAAIMDPQHRHFIEVCWEALEAGALVPDAFGGTIGVFAGCGANTYMINNLLSDSRLLDQLGWFLLRHTGNDKDFFVNNVAYRLGLTGPAVNVQTACSTSLVAVHLAAQSLINYECDAALAGGATIEVPHGVGYLYREGEIMAADGRCRAFDARSAGTVFSSGAGVVLLRRLQDAIDDDDPVVAVIKATAVNNDGNRKVGFLAPSVDGHADVVKEALSLAELSARDIGLVDGHGTGTEVGDPIEVAALTEAFRASTDDTGFCRLTSTKPNIGHTDTSAGVASLIKVVQAIRHRTLPPLANHTAPSPLLGIDDTPFELSGEASPWESDGPRRAGVSSLGVGGTNAHVIVEESPVAAAPPDTDLSTSAAGAQLVTLSAASPTALRGAAERLAAYASEHADLSLADVVTTARTGRTVFAHRMVIGARPDSLADDLANAERGLRQPAIAQAAAPRLGFMFPGGGAQYPGIGEGLGPRFDVYRQTLDELRDLFLDLDAPDLRDLLDPTRDPAELSGVAESLLIVFSTSVAMGRQWLEAGAQPDFFIGHSLGEYVAAHFAGVMDLSAAATLVAGRARLMAKVGGENAATMVVPAAEDEITGRLSGALCLATVNAPDECAVAGPKGEILELAAQLEAEGLPATVVPIDVAAHSSLLDPILPDFLEIAQRVELREPRERLISNVTGTWMTAGQATNPTYWVDHLRSTVRFADGLRTAIGDEPTVVAELGPGQTLSSYARRNPASPVGAIPALRHADSSIDDDVFSTTALGRLWTYGVAFDLDSFAPATGRRVALPTYAFDHHDCWVDRAADAIIDTTGVGQAEADGGPRRLGSVDEMSWTRSWVAADAPEDRELAGQHWLVVGDRDDPVRGQLVAELGRYATVTAVDAAAPTLPVAGIESVVMLAGLEPELPSRSRWLDLAPELCRLVADSTTARFVAVTRRAVGPDLAERPADAMALGAVAVAPAEYPGLRATLIDLDATTEIDRRVLADVVGGPDGVVAHRGTDRLRPQLHHTALATPESSPLIEAGTYLVTGALGGVGGVIAEHLATACQARLAIVTSTPIPDADERDEWLASHGIDDPTSRRIRRLHDLEAVCERVEVIVADLDSPDGVDGAIAAATERLGPLDGVVHAAGRLHDDLISTFDVETARSVVEPKADAALAFVEACRAAAIGQLLLVSSTSTALAPVGQLTYVASNAVLDTLAGHRGPTTITTIGFGLWAEIGMASAAGARARLGLPDSDEAVDHPVFTEVHRGPDTVMFVGRLDARHHWIIDEHRTAAGIAVLPGTGHLDLMASAISLAGSASGLADVGLFEPLLVADTTPVFVRVTIDQSDDPTIRVESDAGTSGEWVLHSEARLVEPDTAPFGSLAASAPDADAERVDLFADQRSHLALGPRWSAAADLSVDGATAANTSVAHAAAANTSVAHATAQARIELSAATTADLAVWHVHPALADLATAVGVRLRVADGLHVPAGYDHVRWHRPLTAVVDVLAVRRDDSTAEQLVVDLDIRCDGELALQVRGLRLVILDADDLSRQIPAGRRARGTVDNLATLADEFGLRPAEGIALLERTMASGDHYAIGTSVSLDALAVLSDPSAGGTDESPADDTPAATLEDEVRAAFAELLGVESVQADDDFFDLGGHSLLAIRLTSRLQKALGIRLPIASLANASTPTSVAALLREADPAVDERFTTSGSVGAPAPAASTGEGDAAQYRSLVAISTEGRGRPLHVVHGAGGNVLFLWSLARALAGDRPVYGFQAKGSEGDLVPDPSIEAMAERYVDEMIAAGPGPYLLGGFSGGGMVAAEMTRVLADRGEHADLVVLFDSPSPQRTTVGRVRRWVNTAGTIRRHGLGAAMPFLREHFGYWLRRFVRPSAYRAAQVEQIERELGYVAEDPGVTDLYFHFTATAERYQRAHYPADFALIRAATVRPTQTEDYGWGELADGTVRLYTTPGDHHSMFYPENAGPLADNVRAALDVVDPLGPVRGSAGTSEG